MAEITHSDEVVTKSDLANFYQMIYPYLGGMPEVLANTFNKSDLYSTDEKMIGQWIDGKPLYQKVIESELTNFTTSFKKYGTIGVSNISVKFLEYIVVDGNENNYYGQNTAADDEESYAYIEGSTGDFYFKLDKNWTSAVHQIIAIVKYTKTTDSALTNIGSDTDYSTTEKIIGTWIDGKPIWQKTIDCGSVTTKTVNHGISNIDNIIDVKGVAINLSTYETRPLPYVNTSSETYQIQIEKVTRTLIDIITPYNWTALTAYVTIQYTKTTD